MFFALTVWLVGQRAVFACGTVCSAQHASIEYPAAEGPNPSSHAAMQAMIATGCIMARVCHTNNCPVGVASQREELRARFPGELSSGTREAAPAHGSAAPDQQGGRQQQQQQQPLRISGLSCTSIPGCRCAR